MLPSVALHEAHVTALYKSTFTYLLTYLCVCVFKNEYLALVQQCMNFACELMDLCRGTLEVEAVLSESNEETGAYDPLDRLKMAMNYEEKKARRPVVISEGT